MNFIKENTIGEAWLKTIDLILNSDFGIITDDKGIILELLSVVIEITKPQLQDRILNLYADKKQIEFIKNNFQNVEAISNWGYSYAKRLYQYKGINQIATVIEKLKANRFSKSATITLLDAQADTQHTPCLVSIDFKIRNDRLIVAGFFRSQDIGKKMYADSLELFEIGHTIANALNLEDITLINFISSAHIYKEDLPIINKICDLEAIKRPAVFKSL